MNIAVEVQRLLRACNNGAFSTAWQTYRRLTGCTIQEAKDAVEGNFLPLNKAVTAEFKKDPNWTGLYPFVKRCVKRT